MEKLVWERFTLIRKKAFQHKHSDSCEAPFFVEDTETNFKYWIENVYSEATLDISIVFDIFIR